MAQKIVPQPCPLGSPGNQTRNIGKHRAIPTGPAHHAQVGNQGGEGVIGNFGARGRQHRNQGALTGVGQADDAHFSQQLQLQLEHPLFALLALGELLRRPVAVAEVVGIAEATPSPRCHQQLIPLVGEVAQQNARAGIADLGATGHLDHEVVATGSGAAVRTAPAAINGLEDPLVLEVQQGLEVAISQ